MTRHSHIIINHQKNASVLNSAIVPTPSHPSLCLAPLLGGWGRPGRPAQPAKQGLQEACLRHVGHSATQAGLCILSGRCTPCIIKKKFKTHVPLKFLQQSIHQSKLKPDSTFQQYRTRSTSATPPLLGQHCTLSTYREGPSTTRNRIPNTPNERILEQEQPNPRG